MAFDAGMLGAVAHEIYTQVGQGRIEKIHGPSRDEVVISFRPEKGKEQTSVRLLINAGANSPRMQLTCAEISNPATPPTFIQLLRKHLSGAKLIDVRQQGFERVIELVFEAHDEMEFKTTRYLICEIMGKYSNIILTNAQRKILACIKTIDLLTSAKRQVIPGMLYEEPPAQDKLNPFEETEEHFYEIYAANEQPNDKFIISNYMGISPLTSREISRDATDVNSLWNSFDKFRRIILEANYTPTLIRDETGKPCEFSFMPINQYGSARQTETYDSFSALLDLYFAERGRVDRTRQKAADLCHLIDSARARLERKLEALASDLATCTQKEDFKRYGDLITSNIYAIKKGAKMALLVDYYDEQMPEVSVPLDSRLTPAQNAQKYYKQYNKLKKGEIEISHQIELAKSDLLYINSVADEFNRAESETDISEIRAELYNAGYGSRMKGYSPQKQSKSKPLHFVTTHGYHVYCGKNNIQNEYLTHKFASRGDYWFHVKNAHGSHVIMQCDGMDEPDGVDFTEAAMIAAYYSSLREGSNVEVDYTLQRNLKRPPSAKPGFVIYHTNYSCIVTPDADKINSLKNK